MLRRAVASTPTIFQPFAGRIALAILVAVCAVAAHQATYLLRFGGDGFGEAMGAGGHDGYWAPLTAVVLLAATILSVVTVRQLVRLSAHAAHLDGGAHPGRELRTYLWSTGALWLRLGLATITVYALQENLERVMVGLPPSGLDVVAAHGLLSIIMVLATSLTVAAVAALVRWRCGVLLARLARHADRRHRHVAPSARPPRATRLPRMDAAAERGSRAPPVVASAV